MSVARASNESRSATAALVSFSLLCWIAIVAGCGTPVGPVDVVRTDATDTLDVATTCSPACVAGQTCDRVTLHCVTTTFDAGPSDSGPTDDNVVPLDVTHDGCTPDCQRRICGDDGCGGTCGSCGTGQSCVNGMCQAGCVPESDIAMCTRLHKNCDTVTAMDNCGTVRTASCGVCTSPQTCGGAGQPNVCGSPAGNCAGRVCGSDGAGGSCGTCPPHSTCTPDQSICNCDNGYAPSADGSACLAIGQPCPAGSPADYCVGGQYWLVCEPRWGLQFMDCGAGQCQPNANGVGHGSCTCGSNGTTFPSLGTAGSCAQPTWTNIPGEDQFVCAAGRTYFFNCRDVTQRESGRCWALVSSFGSQSSCHCDTCVQYDPRTRSCSPACLGGLQCSVIDTANRAYTCQ